MERLPKINEAFAELTTDMAWANGSHIYERIHKGRGGIKLGLREYDPARDNPADINRLNIMQYLGDGTQRYVDKIMPEKSLVCNLVVHVDPQEKYYDELLEPVAELRTELAKETASEIELSSIAMDRFNIYAIGATGDVDFGDLEPEVVSGTEDTDAANKALAEICLDGLTLIFSNFYKLELIKLHRSQTFKQAIAVKFNHGIELEMPADVGKVKPPYTDMRVNTRKPKELDRYNAERAAKHAAIRRGIGGAGAQFVQVAHQGRANKAAVFAKADHDIAKALHKISEI